MKRREVRSVVNSRSSSQSPPPPSQLTSLVILAAFSFAILSTTCRSPLAPCFARSSVSLASDLNEPFTDGRETAGDWGWEGGGGRREKGSRGGEEEGVWAGEEEGRSPSEGRDGRAAAIETAPRLADVTSVTANNGISSGKF